MNSFFRSLLLLLLSVGMILSRPIMQKIVVNNHVWEVPDEPGWEEVVKDAELVRHYLDKCQTPTECLKIVKALRDVFYSHSVSRKYFESNAKDLNDTIDSIFKWG